MTFQELQIIEPILRSLNKIGYTQPTPIQEKSIPHLLRGRDVFGCAQTGTGKTAAFALPILQLLYAKKPTLDRGAIKALILAPTRELALQISESFGDYGENLGIKHAVIFGGVSQHSQTEAIRRGVNILVATPGRLLDLMNQGYVKLNAIEFFVLDEADRMLDMGFIHDIKKIIAKLPSKRQTFFFSATIPNEIKGLSDSLLHDPIKVEAAPASSAAESVEQSLYYVEKAEKPALLELLLKDETIDNVLVFTRTKHGADKVVRWLKRGGIDAEAIHGNKSQNARQRALAGFKNKTLRVLVATDIASRGIDVDKLSHVINYELPDIPETYVHRIGRTGRAGASGIAISFCASDEKVNLKDITRLLKKNIPVVETPKLAAVSMKEMNARGPAQAQQHGGRRSHTTKAKPAQQRQFGSSNTAKAKPAHQSAGNGQPKSGKPSFWKKRGNKSNKSGSGQNQGQRQHSTS